MPPLDAALMAVFLEEMLTVDENLAIAAGQIVERGYESAANGKFVIKARLESGRAKMTIRRGVFRGPASPSQSAPQPNAAAAPPPPAPETNLPALPVHAPAPSVVSAGEPTPGVSGAMLRQLLSQALARDASDVFLSAGHTPAMKVLGQVMPMAGSKLTDDRLLALFEDWLPPPRRAQLDSAGSVDFGLQIDSQGPRFRVNLFRQFHGLAAALRPIKDRVPDLSQLALPRTLLRMVAAPHGLVLMTGPTGSGKSTTLAALLEHVNRTRACHVVTLEDPIEYQFPSDKALFHQREIGTHIANFSTGLRAALRESPDIILVGEMRDPETIALALTAAETGHLVLSTLHAGSATGAIDRMINGFSESQRSAVRGQIAACLRFVVTQHLVPSIDGHRIPVVEQLAVNHAVAAQIRDGRTHLLTTQMELGTEEGMVTLEASLLDLVRQGRITSKTALAVAPNPETLEALLAGQMMGRGKPR